MEAMLRGLSNGIKKGKQAFIYSVSQVKFHFIDKWVSLLLTPRVTTRDKHSSAHSF